MLLHTCLHDLYEILANLEGGDSLLYTVGFSQVSVAAIKCDISVIIKYVKDSCLERNPLKLVEIMKDWDIA